ncbi:alpha-glucan family phosphorylase [Candidatus Woesearchaeota archaeon]|nr:alpha-glucan family phosphorylase [Candidatus Woesearchaeota archaeon]
MIPYADIPVAYFSMEIGISSDIPTYSGGLGVLAGDTLRSAADLELPLIGVSLLYRKGYFVQRIDEHGNQYEEEASWDPERLLEPLPNAVSVQIEGRDVRLKAWLYRNDGITGHTNPIIFLDTDTEENAEQDRGLTHHLYGHDERYRLCQEIVLGIGGIRMLESLGCTGLRKYHMNEGHSALLTLELFRRSKAEDPWEDVREKCVFTTHTPVPAGHDQFPEDLARRLLGSFVTDELSGEVFLDGRLNMTNLGLRFSTYINGVAKKHGEVSRSMFPGYHIESITNGVHSTFWTAEPLRKLFDRYLPGWEADPFSLRYVLSIPTDEIWEAHQEAKKALLAFVNGRYQAKMDLRTFTIGFARRAATYKRADMLFADIGRLRRIAEKCGGIQIIYAGKAHPKDWEGKQVIKRIHDSMQAVKDRIRVCYVENYDIAGAKLLVSGVDLWLNTPMRPHEASGTSGMKAAHNGVPHFSVLDGWWLEGHIENVTGWSIGAGDTKREGMHENEVEEMYTKLEYIILPRYYGDPGAWVNTMRHAIAINGSFFNTHRMVQQYVLNAYFK